MTETDQPQFERIMTKLAAVYGAKANPDMIDGYFLALKGFPIATVERACQAAVDECQFMPKPVELRSFASEPDRFPDEDERTFACLRCYDRGVILTDRNDRTGRPLGPFAAPCSCSMGEAKRAAWEKPDSKGHSLAETARSNTAKLRKAGAL
jgi:hypothetical protein